MSEDVVGHEETELQRWIDAVRMDGSHEQTILSYVAALRARAEKAEALLRRLYGWDVMNVKDSDGAYWRNEITVVLGKEKP